MAQKYFACYHSYLKSAEMLTDAEFGRLIRACIEYSKSGEAPELRGNERFIFPMIQQQIDSGKELYEAKCQQNRENIRKRWNTTEYDRIGTNTNDTNIIKDNINKYNKNKKEVMIPNSFSDNLKNAVEKWLAYKRERRESYKEQGLKALFSQIENKLQRYSESDLIALIEECMANGWRGIIWDRLDRKPQKPQTSATYDLDEWESITKSYVPTK